MRHACTFYLEKCTAGWGSKKAGCLRCLSFLLLTLLIGEDSLTGLFMNVSHLYAIIDSLLVKETTLDVQGMLDRLNVASQSLASNPNAAQFQNEFVTHLNALDAASPSLSQDFGAAELRLLGDIGAAPFFVVNMAEEVRRLSQENPMTPTVVHQYVADFCGKRAQYIETLRRLKQGFETLAIPVLQLEPGSAEVSFTLPRNLFSNNLEGLISELGQVKLIIRAFSEISLGSAVPIELQRISTSDPSFVFGLPIKLIALLGDIVKWCLERWKDVEEIRRIRAETERTKAFSNEEIVKFFDERIKQQIDENVSKKCDELINLTKELEESRQFELRKHLEIALRSILARIERGMTVDVRAEKPIASDESEHGIEYEGDQKFYDEVIANTKGLQFPTPSGKPILELPGVQETKS